jgi:hypothetical protein
VTFLHHARHDLVVSSHAESGSFHAHCRCGHWDQAGPRLHQITDKWQEHLEDRYGKD